MIEVEQLSIAINSKRILSEVSLTVKPGEVVAIIGPNGAGKSTLLKAIAGDLCQAKGAITINGRAIADYRPLELAKVRGVLSQSIPLSFSISVLETVAMGRFPFQQMETTSQRLTIARKALAQVRLSGFEDRTLPTLSGGEQQRVHFARTLAQLHQPDARHHRFLLLDEPTASQDIAQQHRLLGLAKRLASYAGYGILVVLHDMNLAAQYADKVVMMRQGKVICTDQPKRVFTPEHIRNVFDIQAVISQHPVLDCPYVTTFAYPANPYVSPLNHSAI